MTKSCGVFATGVMLATGASGLKMKMRAAADPIKLFACADHMKAYEIGEDTAPAVTPKMFQHRADRLVALADQCKPNQHSAADGYYFRAQGETDSLQVYLIKATKLSRAWVNADAAVKKIEEEKPADQAGKAARKVALKDAKKKRDVAYGALEDQLKLNKDIFWKPENILTANMYTAQETGLGTKPFKEHCCHFPYEAANAASTSAAAMAQAPAVAPAPATTPVDTTPVATTAASTGASASAPAATAPADKDNCCGGGEAPAAESKPAAAGATAAAGTAPGAAAPAAGATAAAGTGQATAAPAAGATAAAGTGQAAAADPNAKAGGDECCGGEKPAEAKPATAAANPAPAAGQPAAIAAAPAAA